MQDIFHSEKLAGPARAIKIRIDQNAPMRELVRRLDTFVEKCLGEEITDYVIDMKDLAFPSTSFIAFLISTAFRVRARNGDLRLENLSQTAQSNLLTFSGWNYLSAGIVTTPATPPPSDFRTTRDDRARTSHNPIADIPEPQTTRRVSNGSQLQREHTKPIAQPNIQASGQNTFSKRVESRVDNLYQLCDFVINHAQKAGMNTKMTAKLRIAVYEACLNVIEHAYHSHPGHWIDLSVQYSPRKFTITILDRGLSFELKPDSEYDVTEAVNQRKTGGFGMHIIRRSVDHLEYHPDSKKGNRLIMVKNL